MAEKVDYPYDATPYVASEIPIPITTQPVLDDKSCASSCAGNECPDEDKPSKTDQCVTFCGIFCCQMCIELTARCCVEVLVGALCSCG
ncbi:unnamed protein product [Caenorhabditis brenneri]